eukprot:SAG11_NODE_4992_length_1699_cov_1.660000_1_plen_109_part_00
MTWCTSGTQDGLGFDAVGPLLTTMLRTEANQLLIWTGNADAGGVVADISSALGNFMANGRLKRTAHLPAKFMRFDDPLREALPQMSCNPSHVLRFYLRFCRSLHDCFH